MTWLRGPAFDLGLLGFAWLPFYLWAAFGLGLGLGDVGGTALPHAEFREALLLAIVVALGITYVHRHYTMVVVYGDPTTFATRARAFLIAPLVVFGVVVLARATAGVELATIAGNRISPWLLILTLSGLWNVWHTVQQRYGILRIYGGKAGGGLESRAHARRDRSLVWSWVAATGALVLLFRTETLALNKRTARGLASAGHLLEHPAVVAFLVAVLAAALVIFVWWLRGERAATLSWRERGPRLAFLASTALLFGVFVLHGPVMGYLVFGTAHALEYVAFVHYFGARKFAGRDDRSPAALLLRHPWRYAPLLAGGLLAAYLLLRRWGNTDVYLAYYFGTSLLHFLYDGWIWKVRKPEVARPLGVGA